MTLLQKAYARTGHEDVGVPKLYGTGLMLVTGGTVRVY